MSIQRSAATEIRQLVERLASGNVVDRDAASARLAVIGPRATRALVRALDAAGNASAQTAILRTLEAIHDPHGLGPVMRWTDSEDLEVASAAVSVLRRFLRYDDAALANAAFERLTSVTLDPTRPAPVRAAALEALSDLPEETTREIVRQLENDADPLLRAASGASRPTEPSRGTLADITEASLCPEPVVLRGMLEKEAHTIPLPVLGRLIELLRSREEAETASPRRTEWQAARAAVHQALSERNSRLALYDLRESLRVIPAPLPVGFLAALERVGEASCLEEVAAAYLRARKARDGWWTEHLAGVFREITRRERLTRRSAALKRVIAKYPEAAEDLLPSKR
jgi:histone H3/H4